MDMTMRADHMTRITNVQAELVYDRLCNACEQRDGGMTASDQMLVFDIAYAEQVKQLCMDDIAKRGLGQERINGRQKYYAENKSVAMHRSYVELQRKVLAELKLTPNSRKADSIPVDDDFADF